MKMPPHGGLPAILAAAILPGLVACNTAPLPYGTPLGPGIVQSLGATRGESAAMLMERGNTLARDGKHASALALFEEAAHTATNDNQPLLVAQALGNAARMAGRQGRTEAAETFIRRAQAFAERCVNSREQAKTLLGLGTLLYDIRKPAMTSAATDAALQLLTAGVKAAETANTPGLRAYGYGALGTVYLAALRLDSALALTRRAVFMAQSAQRPDLLFRWLWQSARILKAQNRPSDAITAYRSALAALQPIRHDVPIAGNENDPSPWATRNLYYELADLLLQEDGRTSGNLSDIRGLVEQARIAELEDYYRDDCIAAWLEKTTGIDHVADRTAALYPILFPDRVELILSVPNGMKRFTVKRDSTGIIAEALALRTTLEKRSTRQYLPHAQKLYRWLIQPLESTLRAHAIDTLVFVPDGVLRLVPVAALHDGTRFLIQRFAIATSPGLSLTDPHPFPREQPKALLLGLSQGAAGLPPLPYVDDELDQVARQFPATVLRNDRFRLPQLQEVLQATDYRIVHVASHGEFGERSADAYILAADGRIGVDALGKLLSASRYRDKPVELLGLSACQTAAGDERAALGLAGLAVKAGARSALATLWSVNDAAASSLVAEFYRVFKEPGTSKAKALQKAQLSLLQDKRYRHPNYWSPFLMIGNWL